ncbi:AAA family ATPase [Phytoactinopolyspora limicola]|uniref:AAA family ATPase n=1 Tax=Phytoactinopolyspora limicola TaxID=2715536 RepID=UPI00140A4780|nr:AAA family ATPase [Phytoactinopolyspora limicola]
MLGGEMALRGELIGRDEEHDRLWALVTATLSGSGGGAVVTGNSGVGKTALLRDLADRARADGGTEPGALAVSYVVGAGAEREWPYSGLHLALSAVADSLASRCPAESAHLVQSLLKELTPTATGYEVAIRLQALIAEVAAPVVLLIDDAHLLDPRSQEVLGFVTRRLRGSPVVVVVAGLAGEEFEQYRGLTAVHLDELPSAEAVRLVQRAGNPPVRRAVAERIVALAGGNPRVLLDAVSRLPVAQLTGHVELDRYLPKSPVLHDMFGAVLDGLDDTRRHALLLAAAADGHLAPLTRALDGAVDGTAAWLLDHHLDGSDGTFRFRQPPLQSLVWQAATPSEQRRAHQELAEVLSGPTAGQPEADQSVWHLAQTTIDEDDDLAARLMAAAHRARTRGEVDRALALSRDAVRLTGDTWDRGDRLIVAGNLALVSGRLDEAIGMARERFTQDTTAVQRADLALLEVRARNLLGGDVAVGLIARHVEEVGELDPGRAARLELAGAMGFAWRMEQAEASRLLTLAGHYAADFDDATRHAHQCASAWIGSISGDPCTAATQLPQEAPSKVGEGDVLSDAEWSVCRAMVLMRAERMDEARRLLQDVVMDGRFSGATLLQSAAQSALVELEVRAGRLPAAHAAATAWERTAIGGVWRSVVSAHMIRVYGLLGEPELAWQCRQQAVEGARRHGDGWATAVAQAETGALLLVLGQLDEAVPVLEHARRYALEHVDPSLLPAEPEYIEACIRAGEPGRAGAALADFADRVQKVPSAWAQHALARCRALTAEGEASIELFHEAVDVRAELVSPLELARTMLCFGERLRRLGRRVEAARWLYRGLVLAQECGAGALVTRAERELRAAGRSPASETAHLGELTEAEQRIASRVAAGKRNREIATELFISVRTVETHLGRIFRKLGIRSRTELVGLVKADTDPTG